MEGRVILNILKKFFSKEPDPPKLREDYYTFNYDDHVWGHSFQLTDQEYEGMRKVSKVWGHYTPRPKNGDLLTMSMQSGRKSLWVIFDCEYPGDPRDMFFAKISFLGYEDEVTLQPSTNKMLTSEWIF